VRMMGMWYIPPCIFVLYTTRIEARVLKIADIDVSALSLVPSRQSGNGEKNAANSTKVLTGGRLGCHNPYMYPRVIQVRAVRSAALMIRV
jgi:hypothetical protein